MAQNCGRDGVDVFDGEVHASGEERVDATAFDEGLRASGELPKRMYFLVSSWASGALGWVAMTSAMA